MLNKVKQCVLHYFTLSQLILFTSKEVVSIVNNRRLKTALNRMKAIEKKKEDYRREYERARKAEREQLREVQELKNAYIGELVYKTGFPADQLPLLIGSMIKAAKLINESTGEERNGFIDECLQLYQEFAKTYDVSLYQHEEDVSDEATDEDEEATTDENRPDPSSDASDTHTTTYAAASAMTGDLHG